MPITVPSCGPFRPPPHPVHHWGVTTRQANLHDDIVEAPGAATLRSAAGTGLYAVAYRPVVRDARTELDVWAAPCALGEALPTLPLRLQGDLFVPVDFESTYAEACRKRRIPNGVDARCASPWP